MAATKIEYVDRDFNIPAEKQKRQIKKELEKQGKTVTYISSLGSRNGKIQVWYM